MTTCSATKANGEPCGTSLGLIDGLCIAHDPARKEAAKAMRVQGGKASSESKRKAKEEAAARRPANIPKPPKNAEDATEYYAWVVDALATGQIDARAAHELTFTLNGFRAAAHARDLERANALLRKQLAEAKRKA